MKLQEKINYYYNFFDYLENKEIYTLKDNAPQELKDAVHKAHGDRLPDDYIFQWFNDILSSLNKHTIENKDDLEEKNVEICDNIVSVYTSDLTNWLNRNNNNVNYLTEALESSSNNDGFNLLSQAQFYAILEVYNTIVELLTA